MKIQSWKLLKISSNPSKNPFQRSSTEKNAYLEGKFVWNSKNTSKLLQT